MLRFALRDQSLEIGQRLGGNRRRDLLSVEADWGFCGHCIRSSHYHRITTRCKEDIYSLHISAHLIYTSDAN